MIKNLELFSDLSERLSYNLPNFPLYVYKGTLQQFNRFAASCHWHADLEFILVLEGTMDYFINGQTVKISKNEGIFVNSRRMHYGFSDQMLDCSYIVIAVHPSILGESMSPARIFWEEKFGHNTEDFILLNKQTPWQNEILDFVEQIYDEMHNKDIRNPLQLLSLSMSLCACLGDHIQPISDTNANEQFSSNVWRMLEFIHQHYELKIALDDIAAAGSVCRSQCCKFFNKYMGQTPNTYLTRYRIHKSVEMLQETRRSICEIAIACGFQNPSYFSQIFRKETGHSPKDYRNQALN